MTGRLDSTEYLAAYILIYRNGKRYDHLQLFRVRIKSFCMYVYRIPAKRKGTSVAMKANWTVYEI